MAAATIGALGGIGDTPVGPVPARAVCYGKGRRDPGRILWARAVALLAVAAVGCGVASTAAASDWQVDLKISLAGSLDWVTATLEQPVRGYLESEKIAVGCSGSILYVQRYSPHGHSTASIVRFDDGPSRFIEWTRLDAPNTMWAYGAAARSIIDGLLSARTVSFQEVSERARVPVNFDVEGAAHVLGPIADTCREGVPTS
jgi:hypothetical protein